MSKPVSAHPFRNYPKHRVTKNTQNKPQSAIREVLEMENKKAMIAHILSGKPAAAFVPKTVQQLKQELRKLRNEEYARLMRAKIKRK